MRMSDGREVLGIISARGGSKGLPRKNVLPLVGKPLIAWTVAAAVESGVVSRLICSTDDSEIASAAEDAGAEIPFVRPAELASDSATSLDVVLHALDQMEQAVDWVCLLQPTSPLRTGADLRGAFDLACAGDAPAVVSVCEAASHPYLCYQIQDSGRIEGFFGPEVRATRRQDMPAAYTLNGAIYFIKPSVLRETRTFVPPGTMAYVMPVERSIDIDDASDFAAAERYLMHP